MNQSEMFQARNLELRASLLTYSFTSNRRRNDIICKSLVLTSDITLDNFSSETYQGKAGRIFFSICFCSTISYARSHKLVLMSMFTSHNSMHYFVMYVMYAM